MYSVLYCIAFVAVNCGALENPNNGSVSVPETVFSNMATYVCDTGYVLSGGSTRTCQVTGEWSGNAPTCEGKYK